MNDEKKRKINELLLLTIKIIQQYKKKISPK